MERFINDLREALANEVVIRTDLDVFVDSERLQGGVFFNEALGQALCSSVCLIVIYTPTYFSKEHPYCALEFKAMEKLEEERLKLLQGVDAGKCGLIIPIILRGEASFPQQIRSQRQCYNFASFKLRDTELKENPDYDEVVQEIAEYIYQRYQSFQSAPKDPTEICSAFSFPTEDEITQWIEQVTVRTMPFPGR